MMSMKTKYELMEQSTAGKVDGGISPIDVENKIDQALKD
jgi:hypothetical protein